MILVSACLLGECCKYDGGHNRNTAVLRYLQGKQYQCICPETDGGLAAPRAPAERVGDWVIAKDGADMTDAFYRGARLALEKALEQKPTLIILKANSPSCGVGQIYDGTFTGRKISGNGVAAQLLAEAGFRVVTEKEIERWEKDLII